MWRYLVLLMSLLGMSVAQKTGTYTLLMPKSMRPDSNFEVSVTYYFTPANANTLLDVQMFLTDKDNNTLIKLTKNDTITAVSCVAPAIKCPVNKKISFKLPATLEESSYNVTVNGTMGKVQVFSNSTTVKVNQKICSVLIQTDRAMYKPSQTVKFRVLVVDPKLKPENNPVNVSIQDANDNRIKQWLLKTPVDGVFGGELSLSDQPPLGDWTIQVLTQGCTNQKSFEIAEYVLPKYEVTMDLPSFFVFSMENIFATVIAKYTFGQPVRGSCFLRVQMKKYVYESTEYGYLTMNETLKDGKAVFTVTEKQLISLVPRPRYTYSGWTPQRGLEYREVEFSATCTEELTSKTFVENGTVPVKRDKLLMEVLSISPDTYKPGLNYTLYAKVMLADKSTAPPSDLRFPNGSSVEIELWDTTYDYMYYRDKSLVKKPNATTTVGADGMAIFVLTIPKESTTANFRATFNNTLYAATAYKTVIPFKSIDTQAIQVQLVGTTGKVKAGEDAVFKIVTSELAELVYLYMFSKGEIVKYYPIKPTGLNTLFQAQLDALSAQALSPNARAIVLVQSDGGEFISDSIDFGMEGAFANNVSMRFSKDQTKPGEDVKVTVNAYPNSLVGLLAIDKSAQLLATGNDLSRDEVIEELKSFDTSRDPYDYRGGPIMFERGKRSVMPCWGCYPSMGGTDTMDLINNAGMKFLTDFVVYVKPPPRDLGQFRGCGGGIRGKRCAIVAAALDKQPESTSAPIPEQNLLKDAKHVRNNFPETWLWAMSNTGWRPEDDHLSGMTLIEFTALSGYVPTNLDELKRSVKGLKRVEQKDKKTVFYLDELRKTQTCFIVQTERVNRVSNLQKAKVQALPYYEPDMTQTAYYLPSLLAGELGSEVCINCPECCPPTGPKLILSDKQVFNMVEVEIIYGGHTTPKPPKAGRVLSGATATVPMATAIMMALTLALLFGNKLV